MSSTVLGQNVLASAREFIVRAILRLPLSRVESASSGDLVTRVTRDVGTMSESVRWALPESIIASITVVLTLVAMVSNSLAAVAAVDRAHGRSRCFQVRRYLRRAPKGYLTEGGTYSRINTTLTETVEGARTVEALGLGGQRLRRGDDDIEVSGQAERYTMTLRNLLFVVMDVAFSLPRVLVLLFGAIGYAQGWATLGQLTTAILYAEALWGPFDMLVHTVDRVQVGHRLDDPTARHRDRAAPTARLEPTGRTGATSSATTCATPTAPGTTCCTASTSTCARVSASPSSGPAALASRPSAGCCRASTARARGRSPSAGWS